MPVISYAQALANRTANAHRSWFKWEAHGKVGDDPTTARDRYLAGGPFIVQSEPRFRLKPGASVYTIGSCFARYVEMTLKEAGFAVPALDVEIDQSIYVTPPHFPLTILNKYNAHSMALEIDRALGRFNPLDDGLIEIGEDKWFDPQMAYTALRPRALVVQEREKLNRLTARLLDCDALVLTLGLTETWRDAETGIVFNAAIAPIAAAWRRRLEMFNARPQEVYDVLAESLGALHAARPAMKVVLTVSPVPLGQTFTRQDAVAANTRSKAVLRAAADMLYEDFDFIDYYPSFEMVMNSPRHLAWADDQAHVSSAVSGPVIAEFARRYVRAA